MTLVALCVLQLLCVCALHLTYLHNKPCSQANRGSQGKPLQLQPPIVTVVDLAIGQLDSTYCMFSTVASHHMNSHFLTLAKAAAWRAANAASAFLALSTAGRGFGMPVAFVVLTPGTREKRSDSCCRVVSKAVSLPPSAASHVIINHFASFLEHSASLCCLFHGLQCLIASVLLDSRLWHIKGNAFL